MWIILEFDTNLFYLSTCLVFKYQSNDTELVPFPPPTNWIDGSSNQCIGHQLPKPLLLTNDIILLIVVLSGYSWFHFQKYRKGLMSVSGQFLRCPHHLRISGCCKAQPIPFFAIDASVPSHKYIPREIALWLIVVYILFMWFSFFRPIPPIWRYRSGTIIWVVGQLYRPLPPSTRQTCSHIPFDCCMTLFCWLWVPWGYVMTINPQKPANRTSGLKRRKLCTRVYEAPTPAKPSFSAHHRHVSSFFQCDVVGCPIGNEQWYNNGQKMGWCFRIARGGTTSLEVLSATRAASEPPRPRRIC